MSPQAPRRAAGVPPGRRPGAEAPISPEEVAAVLAVVKALVEEEAAGNGVFRPAVSDAWAAEARPGRSSARRTRPNVPPPGKGTASAT